MVLKRVMRSHTAALLVLVTLVLVPPVFADWWIQTPSGYRHIGGASKIGPFATRQQAEAVNTSEFSGGGYVYRYSVADRNSIKQRAEKAVESWHKDVKKEIASW